MNINNYFKKIVILFSLFTVLICSSVDAANDPDLKEILDERNELLLAIKKAYPYMFDKKVVARINDWLGHEKVRSYVVDCQFWMRPLFNSPKVLAPLCYLLRQDDKEKRLKYFDVIKPYILQTKLALRELSTDPRYSKKDNKKAKDILDKFEKDLLTKVKSCFKKAEDWDYEKSGKFTPFKYVDECFDEHVEKVRTDKGKLSYFSVNLADEFPNHPGHVVSATGWVPDNRVEYLHWNDDSLGLVSFLQERNDLVSKLYPMNTRGSLKSFLETDLSKVFTETQGFFSFEFTSYMVTGSRDISRNY